MAEIIKNEEIEEKVILVAVSENDGDDAEDSVAELEELVNTAVPYKCTMDGLLQFLDAINLDRTLDAENQAVGDDAVTLITLHNTKGLEYNRVIITGLEEGVFPRMDKTGPRRTLCYINSKTLPLWTLGFYAPKSVYKRSCRSVYCNWSGTFWLFNPQSISIW